MLKILSLICRNLTLAVFSFQPALHWYACTAWFRTWFTRNIL